MKNISEILINKLNNFKLIVANDALEEINKRTCNIPYFKGVFDLNSLLFILLAVAIGWFFVQVIFKKPNMFFANMKVKENSDITQIQSIFYLTILFLLVSSYLSLYFRDCHTVAQNFNNAKMIAHWSSFLMPLALGILLITLKPSTKKIKTFAIFGVVLIFIPLYFFNDLTYAKDASFLIRNLPYTISLIFLIGFLVFGFIQMKKDEKWPLKKLITFYAIISPFLLYFFLINIFEKLW